MATEFDPNDLKAELAKLDDYEIERRIEREIFEGKRLKVAKKFSRRGAELEQSKLLNCSGSWQRSSAH